MKTYLNDRTQVRPPPTVTNFITHVVYLRDGQVAPRVPELEKMGLTCVGVNSAPGVSGHFSEKGGYKINDAQSSAWRWNKLRVKLLQELRQFNVSIERVF